MENSKDKIDTFYEILHDLEDRLGGKRELRNCTGKMKRPHRGVYFFFEQGEKRSQANELRVVRVGTHALKLLPSAFLTSQAFSKPCTLAFFLTSPHTPTQVIRRRDLILIPT